MDIERQPGDELVSVIVPVFNQWHLVPRLLEALTAQTTRTPFEVLLVDNGSSWVPEPVDEHNSVRRLLCTTPGSYAARNHGAAQARGDLLVFTDADCEPDTSWLEAMLLCQSNLAESTIVAGKIKVTAEAPVTLAARHDIALGFPQEQYVLRGYGVTANLSIPRELFERAGGFDAQRLSGGDAEFCRRAAQLGAKVVYCDGAQVNHPARRTITELARKVRRIKGGQLRNGSFRRRLSCGLRGFLPPVRAWWRIWHSPALNLLDRVAVSLLQILLWFVEIAETFRLVAGASAERR